MMKKKLFSFVLVLAVLFVSLPFAVMAASETASTAAPSDNSQQVEYVGGWNPANYPITGELYQDKIAVRKTIAPTAVENYFDITLEVVAKQQYVDQSVDVIMVMDISNTMNATHENLTPAADGYRVEDSRLYEAKHAVNTFVDQYASASGISTDRRFALVTFNSYANVAIPLTKVDTASATSIKTSVNAITAPEDNRVRFTNIEGGLQLAYNLFKTSTAKYKYIIFVTDGFPTTYIESGRDSTSQIVGYDTYMINTTSTYDVSKVGTDGYFADAVTGKLALYGTSYSDKAAFRAANVARSIKASGINIFSIGIDVGVQSVDGYVDKYANNGFTVVDRTSEYYEIGSTTESYKNWLANTVAGGPLLETDKFEEHRYSAGNDETALATAFSNILTDIKLAPSYSFRDAYTLDPMSEFVEFLHFYGYDGKAADSIINNTTDATVATFDDATNTIDWRLINSRFTRLEGDIFSAQITYKVRIKNEVEGFNPSTALETNDVTTLFFKTVDENGNPLYGDNSINYPIPKAEAYLGELNFTKRDAQTEEALAGAEFTLRHYGKSCHLCAGEVEIGDFHATSDENGEVSIVNIPSGHEYVLIEDVAPEGYTIGASHAVAVLYGETYLHTEKIDDNNPGVVYNTHITPVTVNISAMKMLDDSFTGRELEANEFNFVFSGAGQGGATFHEIAHNDAEGNVVFHPITFDMEGEYTFTIYEEKGDDSTIVYDDTVHTVNIAVTVDNPDDPTAYVVETTVDGEAVENDNKISVDFRNAVRGSASAVIEATKTMDGKTPEDIFGFELHGSDGELLQSKKNVGGKITFDEMYFAQAGIYNYSVVETHGDDNGIVYDHTAFDVIVTVTAPDGEDELVASVAYVKNGESVDEIVFENKTRKAATLSLSALKTLDGEKPEADRFTFELRDADGNVIATATNDENGVITFDTLEFDTVGTVEYTLTEVKGDDTSVIYDETVYYLEVNTSISHYSESYMLDVVLKVPAIDSESEVAFVHLSGSDVVIDAEHSIEFKNTTTVPAGDMSNFFIWLLVLAVSGCAVVGTINSIRKKQRDF